MESTNTERSLFNARLRQVMDEYEMTQADLARLTGLSRAMISHYVTGGKYPKIDRIEMMAAKLGVSADWLRGLDVPMHQAKAVPEDAPRIPILGTVAAGQPIFAEQNCIGEVYAGCPADDEMFALVIRGDSMSPRIQDGDIAIVRKQDTAETGDVVIALVNGDEATCKRLQKYPGGIALVPNNPNYHPMYFSGAEIESLPVRIIGKVVEVRARMAL